MERNPSYEDGTLPEYEDVRPQNMPNITVTLSEGNLSESNSSTSSKKETNLKAERIGLVVVLSLLAIAMVAAITLSVYALVSSNQEMDSLQLIGEIQKLKLQLNETKEASETGIEKLKNDITRIETGGVNTLTTANNSTMALLNSLQSSVSSLNTANGATTTQLNSLQSSVSSLNTANGATTTQFNNLQSSVNSLTTRVNSPVNLYQNCIHETTSCTVQEGIGYSKTCSTSNLPVNKSVSCYCYYVYAMHIYRDTTHCMSRECKYNPASGFLDTTALRQSGSNFQCVCESQSRISSGQHNTSPLGPFTCILVITRCPTSQNIV